MRWGRVGEVMAQRDGQWVWESAPLVQTYEEWKQTTGVTDEDEQRYLERRKAGLTRSQIPPEVLRNRANELERTT